MRELMRPNIRESTRRTKNKHAKPKNATKLCENKYCPGHKN